MGPRSENTSSPAGRLHGELYCRPARPEKLRGPTINEASAQAGRLYGEVDCRSAHPERQHGHAIKQTSPHADRLQGEIEGRPVRPERQHGPTIKKYHREQVGSIEKSIASRRAPGDNMLTINDQDNIIARKPAAWISRLPAGASRDTTRAHDQQNVISSKSRP